MADSVRGPCLGEVSEGDLAATLADTGIILDVGVASIRLRGDHARLAQQLKIPYAGQPFQPSADWVDIDVRLIPAGGWRRWLRPQVSLWCDGRPLFDPFPAHQPFPLFEWGCNWLIGQRMNHLLLLHAGVVERNGLAIILPAMPGSGKSTLTAALSLRGWRLLSDEFGALDPVTGLLHPVIKPVGLKNRSIEVIRDFGAGDRLGYSFEATRKGTVAHLAPSPDAVQRRHETAEPGALVLPKWQASSPTRWEPVPQHRVFAALAFNAFNYTVLGEPAFRAAVRLANALPAWQLVYSDLDDALATIDRFWPEVQERAERQP